MINQLFLCHLTFHGSKTLGAVCEPLQPHLHVRWNPGKVDEVAPPRGVQGMDHLGVQFRRLCLAAAPLHAQAAQSGPHIGLDVRAGAFDSMGAGPPLGGAGRLIVSYHSLDELDGILSHIQ